MDKEAKTRMVDKNTHDNENEFEDEFKDEFEFGEENEQERSDESALTPKSSQQRNTKKIMMTLSAIVIIGLTFYLGYRFLANLPKKTSKTSNLLSVLPKEIKEEAAKLKEPASSHPKVAPIQIVPNQSITAANQNQKIEAIQPSDLPKIESITLSKPESAPSPLIEKEVSETKPTTQLTATPTTSTTPSTTQAEQAATALQTADTTEIAAKIAETTPSSASGTTTPESSTSTQPSAPGSIPSTSITPTPAPTPPTPLASPTPPPPPAPTPVPSPSAEEVQVMTLQINKTLEALSKLNNQMENNLNQVKYLDAYTREVSLNVEKLNAQVSAMDNRIQSLSTLANSLSKDLTKVRNEVGYVKRVVGDEGLDLSTPPQARRRSQDYPAQEGLDYPGPRPPQPQANNMVISKGAPCDCEYILHAVIPGRAWLKNVKGQIITVTEGEAIGNYGKVLVIDAANGVVLTSTGVTFR